MTEIRLDDVFQRKREQMDKKKIHIRDLRKSKMLENLTLTMWLSWPEHGPMPYKVLVSIPSQGIYLG